MFFCPSCKVSLQGSLCAYCDMRYREQHGFLIFDESPLVTSLNYHLDQHLLTIENDELLNKLQRYLIPQLGDVHGKRILSVGCGGGVDIAEMNRLGAEAYGMDFLYRVPQWQKLGLSPTQLFVSSAVHIPFPPEYFDVILCMGVIEHVAEHLLDTREYEKLEQERREFLRALVAMLKKGGLLLITTPNRNFPIDFQHDHNILKFLRKFSVYLHSPFTPRLESYYSMVHLLKENDPMYAKPLPLTHFLGFNVTKLSPQLRMFQRLFEGYTRVLDRMPRAIRTSFLNPYIVLEVTKQ